MIEKEITVTVTDETTQMEQELRFTVGLLDYNNYINAVSGNDKIAPSNNFLMQCIHEDDKEKLREYIAEGLTMDFTADVIEAFKPKVKTSVKKRKAKPKA